MPDVPALRDGCGRRVTTLRISLTDRCNFRCVYCMPPEGLPVLPSSDRLTAGEIVALVRAASNLGIRRFRLTGGEPLLRPDVVEIVRSIREIDGNVAGAPRRRIGDLSVTTNGSHLASLAEPLRRAGLDRVNVSLDSLDPGRFSDLSLYRNYDRVRRGIDAAVAAGFPVKLNVVVMAGIADSEILAFADLAVTSGMEVRFLEFMPLCGSGWRPDLVCPIDRVRELIESRYELHIVSRGDHPARVFTLRTKRGNGREKRSRRDQRAGGRIGFISTLTEPFCDSCSRIRISSDGKIRPCLFSDVEVDVKALLASGARDGAIEAAIRHAVSIKPRGSQFDGEPFDVATADKNYGAGPFIRSIGG